jgi:hypothetical protein
MPLTVMTGAAQRLRNPLNRQALRPVDPKSTSLLFLRIWFWPQ